MNADEPRTAKAYIDDEAREAARRKYGSDSVEVDETARVVHLKETEYGAAWVQA